LSWACLSFVALMAAAAPAVSAADADKAWPDRTVRIMTGSAGGPPDAVARTITLALFAACNSVRVVAYVLQTLKAAADKNGAS
jgi:tripartite-type tricarboxylate transporter receptor subunit TctC